MTIIIIIIIVITTGICVYVITITNTELTYPTKYINRDASHNNVDYPGLASTLQH